MTMKRMELANLVLGAIALVLWGVMFLAGTDVWHAMRSPDFWNSQEPPFVDLRAFAYAFYLLLVVLTLHLAVTLAGVVAGRNQRGQDA